MPTRLRGGGGTTRSSAAGGAGGAGGGGGKKSTQPGPKGSPTSGKVNPPGKSRSLLPDRKKGSPQKVTEQLNFLFFRTQ